jgi:hypothetical protein
MHQNKLQAVTLFGKMVVISGNEVVHLLSKPGRSVSRLPPDYVCEIEFFVMQITKNIKANP